jgi:hypothetical protein
MSTIQSVSNCGYGGTSMPVKHVMTFKTGLLHSYGQHYRAPIVIESLWINGLTSFLLWRI